MTTCVYERGNIFQQVNSKFQPVNIISFIYYIHKNKLHDIIGKLLNEYCDVSVIGYNKYDDKFWCKKYVKVDCSLHIELEIINKSDSCSTIKITPLLGNDISIKLFIINLNESLHPYQDPI